MFDNCVVIYKFIQDLHFFCQWGRWWEWAHLSYSSSGVLWCCWPSS